MSNLKNISLISLIISVSLGSILYLRNSYKCKATAEILSKSEISSDEAANNIESILYQSPIESQAGFLGSEILAQKVIDRLRLSNKNGEPLTTKEFSEKLEINILPDNTISVVYFDSDRRLAAKAINTVLELFVSSSIYANEPPRYDVGNFKAELPDKIRIYDPKNDLDWINDKRQEDAKFKASVRKYWQEIDEMNQNIPLELGLNKYQSHDVKILEVGSSCSKPKYLK